MYRRVIKDWTTIGHTLSGREDMVRAMIQNEHPRLRGEFRLTPMPDGFWRIDVRGVVLPPTP